MSQTAVSAVLVVTIEAKSEGLQPGRVIDGLIGGTLALVVAHVLFARDPVKRAAAAADRLLELLAGALELTSEALRSGDANVARRALARARSTSALVAELEEALAAARETVLLSPPRRHAAPHLDRYEGALTQIDYAVRNTRVLARHVHRATIRRPPPPAELADSADLLAQAVRALGRALRAAGDGAETRRLADQASTAATQVLESRRDLASNVIVAQLRATAADIRRGSGAETSRSHRVPGAPPTP
jgi:hypothetical protein